MKRLVIALLVGIPSVCLLLAGANTFRPVDMIRWSQSKNCIEIGLSPDSPSNFTFRDGELILPRCADSNSPIQLYGICANYTTGKIQIRDINGVRSL